MSESTPLLLSQSMSLDVTVDVIGDVVVDGDTATGRSYSSELARTVDGQRLRVMGQYDDRYRKRDGVWAFSYRRFTMLDTEEC